MTSSNRGKDEVKIFKALEINHDRETAHNRERIETFKQIIVLKISWILMTKRVMELNKARVLAQAFFFLTLLINEKLSI